MRVYLDMCSLQRPLDTKTQVRITVEAEAILGIITLWEAGEIELISSPALMFEAEQIALPARKAYVLETLLQASLFIQTSESVSVEEQAQEFVRFGIKPMDALHLALSVKAQADYFCTCDDRFLRRAKQADTSSTKVVSPLELITELAK
jgi:predicted nucleic acid-binding protein